ncbi:hypothetical protein GALL_543090 [mine drainage metagenome]|uniref:Uncharacterized protein n=1 Tax=mine drainage metagenome TaxID=410659 RepID=A0A1J5PKT1_9ZZZZ
MLLQGFELGNHGHAGQYRVAGMVGVRHRRAPERHDGITHVLVDGAAMAVDDLRHRCQKLIHQLCQLLGVKPFGDGGEPAHVGKQHRQVTVGAFKAVGTGVLGHFINQLRWHILAKQAGQQTPATRVDKVAIRHIDHKQGADQQQA